MRFLSRSTTPDLSRYLQKPASVFLAKFLPFSIYRRYLSMLGFWYYATNADERRDLSRSLRYVLGDELGLLKFQRTLFKTYRGIFDHYYEKMINAHTPLTGMVRYLKRQVSMAGGEWLDQLQAENRGCILVSGHYGAVEYIPLYLAARNYRTAIILRFKTQRLKQALQRRASTVDLELIDADSPQVVFTALKAINEGRILITLCDEIHTWRPSRKENATVFGRPTPKDRTLDVLYRRAKAPTCFGAIERRKGGYDLTIHPISDGRTPISLFEAAWQILEEYIYRRPEQWYQWPHFYSEITDYNAPVLCYEN